MKKNRKSALLESQAVINDLQLDVLLEINDLLYLLAERFVPGFPDVLYSLRDNK